MTIQKEIEKLHEQANALAEVKEDLFNAKADITISALGSLLATLTESIQEFMEDSAKKPFYDKELGQKIYNSISELAQAITKMPAPNVNVSPNISVDLKPFQETAKEVLSQNSVIISLINKLESGSKNEDLKPFIEAMIQKSNSVLAQAFKAIDYTTSLTGIEAALKDKPSQWVAKVSKRDGYTKEIEEITITAKK